VRRSWLLQGRFRGTARRGSLKLSDEEDAITSVNYSVVAAGVPLGKTHEKHKSARGVRLYKRFIRSFRGPEEAERDDRRESKRGLARARARARFVIPLPRADQRRVPFAW